MEISKALQEEILCVQNKLKNAIRDHQICVVKLKDDPNNTDILDRIREIQLHIVSLGRWQKQVVERLRKEVESCKAENALNDAQVTIAALLGLGNNNNHMTKNNELVQQRRASVEHGSASGASKSNGHNGRSESRGSSKEDCEEIVRNGDVPSPLRNGRVKRKRRLSSIEPTSGADDDVVELRSARASPETRDIVESEPVDKKPSTEMEHQQQVIFLGSLGLITNARLLELQKKRSERRRRSTANSNFVYSKNWEVPMKRKRHAYLQSLGNAPQTRQTTARLNGPSPPPAPVRNSVGRPPSAKTRSLMQAKAAAAAAAAALHSSKPNILRNGDGKQPKQEFYAGKIIKQEEKSSVKLERDESKLAQTTGKTVHIPGLPSGLTIERIENDSTVCITCRNPGTLTVCEYCSAKFHVSCHTITPASTCYCPKCAARFRSKGLTATDLEILRLEMKSVKKEKETAAASYASRAFGKAGDDSEVHKASGGLYKADAAQASRQQLLTAAALGINQLPSSTFLIPIDAAAPVATAVAPTLVQADGLTVTAVDEPQLVVTTSVGLGSTTATAAATSRLGYSFAEQQQKQQSQQQSSILLSQLSQPSIAAASGEPRVLRQTHQEALPHSQSFLVIEKVTGQSHGQSRWSADRVSGKTKPAVSVLEYSESSRQSRSLAIAKSDKNYVTVEVICSNDDDDDEDEPTELASENSADCVYISESSSGMPDVVDLGSSSPRADAEPKEREPEVHNISSGSSEILAVDSSRPASAAEHIETSTESVESSAAIEHNETSVESVGSLAAEHSSQQCNENISDTDFLLSIFPGRYGYKIDVVDVESSGSESHSYSPEGSRVEQHGHVKLEEAHLPAPPPAELTAKSNDDDVEMTTSCPDDENMTVPDNKSDNAARRDQSYENRDGSQECSESASETAIAD